jgi:hypothetical protein
MTVQPASGEGYRHSVLGEARDGRMEDFKKLFALHMGGTSRYLVIVGEDRVVCSKDSAIRIQRIG